MIRTILSLTTHNPQPTTHSSQPTTHSPQPTAHSSQLFFHSGGGITIDSNPEKEWEETLHKAKALIEAIKV